MIDHNAQKRLLYIKVFKGASFEISSNFKEAVAWFQKQLAQIPEEFQDKAYWDVSNGSHDTSPEIEITYSRLETEEELQVRLQEQKSQEQVKREKEIDLLRVLKVKYPGV